MNNTAKQLAQLDQKYVWHPFTQMRDWLKREPIVLVSGQGAVLRDVRGREYLDANASIWTNLHGHQHPKINAAIRKQLAQVAHTSALGFANEPASLLAEKLVTAANLNVPKNIPKQKAFSSKATEANPRLGKVFFSDDGSTATEVALKQAYEYTRRTGRSRNPRFLALQGAYHGDTVGAVSLGHIDLFHKAYAGLLFKSDAVMAPYCYRCPFNRAKPERADARDYRQCQWECLAKLEEKFCHQSKLGNPYAGFVVEPLMQGAAGMIAQPCGWLARAAQIARSHKALLIADEVMTGFGRTGVGRGLKGQGVLTTDPGLFACHKEGVQPDFLALAKGLTGGYLPMAATLTTQAVFDVFLGEYEEFKTFFHGHSFTGNQLGAAAGLSSFELLHGATSLSNRQRIEQQLRESLPTLWNSPFVGDVRQVGLVAGVELVRDWCTRKPFKLQERVGIRVCEAMAKRGVLTRPIGNVIPLLPPYCCTREQVDRMVTTMAEAIRETLGDKFSSITVCHA